MQFKNGGLFRFNFFLPVIFMSCAMSSLHNVCRRPISYCTLMDKVRSQNGHKSSCLPSAKSCRRQLLFDSSDEHEYSFYLISSPQLAATHVNSQLGYPRVPPCVTTSFNLGMPQPSKGKPHRRWPWPLTCDLCHPHTSNPAPCFCTSWLKMACSLPGVSYYSLTLTDGPNIWRLRHVCAHCGSCLAVSVWICWIDMFNNTDPFFSLSLCFHF